MEVSILELRRLFKEALAREDQARDEALALYAEIQRAKKEEDKSEGIKNVDG